jgi:hypothetical protein
MYVCYLLAEQVGIPLGASTLDVFAHTNAVRGLYKGLQPFDADGFGWNQFMDQLSDVRLFSKLNDLRREKLTIVGVANDVQAANGFWPPGHYEQFWNIAAEPSA